MLIYLHVHIMAFKIINRIVPKFIASFVNNKPAKENGKLVPLS